MFFEFENFFSKKNKNSKKKMRKRNFIILNIISEVVNQSRDSQANSNAHLSKDKNIHKSNRASLQKNFGENTDSGFTF